MSTALSQGYSRTQAEQVLTQAFGESGLDPKISGGVQGVDEVIGIFQEMKAFSGGLSREDRMNAQKNIDAYFRQMMKKGGPDAFTDPAEFLGRKVSVGGPYHPENQAKGHLTAAQQGVAPYISNYGGTSVPVTLDSTSQTALQDIAGNTGAFSNALDPLGLPDTLNRIADNDKLFSDAVAASRGQLKMTDDQVVPALQHLDGLIADQNAANTPVSKQNAQQLESIRGSLMQQHGLTEGPSGLDTAQSMISGASNIASSAFATFDAFLKTISAGKNLTDIMVRGIGNTEDIYNIVENVQSFIEMGQKVAQLVSDVSGFASSLVGAGGSGDPSGASSGVAMALGAVSGISGMVAQGLAAVNTAIDLGQEAYRITTKYMGRFLTQWFGLPGASDIKYLLDEVTGQLQVYTSDNPQMKNTFNTLPRALGADYSTRNQATNNFNIYQGPGQDYRDTMNDAMFSIKSSGVGAFGYAE